MAKRNAVLIRFGILALSCAFLMGVGPCQKGGPDLDMLVDFLADDDALMQEFLDQEPGLGSDITVNGSMGGFCRLTIEGILPTYVTYDYDGYNDSGMIMTGVRSGEASGFLTWYIKGTIELEGTANGWIYYQLPMVGLATPQIALRTWRVCNYDNGCDADVGDLDGEGTSFFTNANLP